MEQYWYIIREKSHFGPYQLSEIQNLKANNKLTDDMAIWHPKWKEPIPCFDERLNHWWSSNDVVTPPPPPKDAYKKQLLNPRSLKHLSRLAKHHQAFEEDQVVMIKLPTFSFLKLPRINMSLALLLSICALWYFTSGDSFAPRPLSMAPTQYEELKNSTIPYHTITSKDFKWLWIANKENSKILSVTLQGNSKNLLSLTNYRATWKLDSTKSLIALKFSSQNLAPNGFYNLQIKYQTSSWFSSKTDEISKPLIMGYHAEDKLLALIKKFHTPVAVTPKKVIKKIARKKIPQNTELAEVYQSIGSLIREVLNEWHNIKVVPAKKRKKAMKDFNQRYAKNIGSFLTTIVLSNEKQSKELSSNQENIDTKTISHLYQLNELAKKTGQLSANLMSDYQQLAKNQKLEQRWIRQMNDLEQEVLDRMSNL